MDVLDQLSSRYISRAKNKNPQCKACQMWLNGAANEELADHFAFNHTEDMLKILNERVSV